MACCYADQPVTFVELHRDQTNRTDIAEIRKPVAAYVALSGGEHQVQALPQRLILRQRQHCRNRVGTELGQKVKRYLDQGELVSDDLVLAIVSDRLKRAKPGGFILDGFPRTVEQARAADRLFAESGEPVDAVIYLDVDREESVRRLLARAGEEGRSDDQESTIRHRLDVFETMTKPLLQYYADRGLVMAIDGEQPIDTVTEEILNRLAAKWSKR